MTDYDQTEVPLKYNYGTIPVSTDNALWRLIEQSHRIDEVIAREMERAQADLIWSFADNTNNRHIGPVHHPNRRDLYEVRQRIRQTAYFRSLGRPRGPYRR
jgi:hypothetical protein